MAHTIPNLLRDSILFLPRRFYLVLHHELLRGQTSKCTIFIWMPPAGPPVLSNMLDTIDSDISDNALSSNEYTFVFADEIFAPGCFFTPTTIPSRRPSIQDPVVYKAGRSLSKDDSEEDAFWLVGLKSEARFQKDLGQGISTRREGLTRLWSNHVQRLVVGWYLLYRPIASLGYGLWKFCLFVFLDFVRLLCSASPPETWIDSWKALNGRVYRSSRIYLIILVSCSAFSVWVLKHPLWGAHYDIWFVVFPFMWVWVNLTCVYVSQVWCASPVSESALQLQGGQAQPLSPPHASLPSCWVPGLFAWYCLQAHRPLTAREVSCMWPMVDASTSEGSRWRQELLLEIVMMRMNSRPGEGVEREALIWEARLHRRWQKWWVILYETFTSKSTTALRRPTFGHLFWRSYIVMTIILCQSLSSQTRYRETRYFSTFSLTL